MEAMLAHKYNPGKHKGPFFASEKLDGIRALYKDGVLYTRKGNPIDAPPWFLSKIPASQTFDGELFMGRKKFTETSSIVMAKKSSKKDWEKIQYRVFDDYESRAPFSETYDRLRKILPMCALGEHVCLERQTPVDSDAKIQSMLRVVEKKGGEGLMLRADGPYEQSKRTHALLKVKSFHDSEAKVIGFDMDGPRVKSLKCVWNVGGKRAEFKVGSGIPRSKRVDVRIGDLVTVKYFELTKTGKPRFPVYKGVRKDI